MVVDIATIKYKLKNISANPTGVVELVFKFTFKDGTELELCDYLDNLDSLEEVESSFTALQRIVDAEDYSFITEVRTSEGEG